jgi:hypothetical protein
VANPFAVITLLRIYPRAVARSGDRPQQRAVFSVLMMHAGGEAIAAQIAGKPVRVAVFMEMPRPRVGAGVDDVVMIVAMHDAGRAADAADELCQIVSCVVIVNVPRHPAVERVVDVDVVMVMLAIMASVWRRGDRGTRRRGDKTQSDNGETKRGELEHGEAP